MVHPYPEERIENIFQTDISPSIFNSGLDALSDNDRKLIKPQER